jgi:hypothetical protein
MLNAPFNADGGSRKAELGAHSHRLLIIKATEAKETEAARGLAIFSMKYCRPGACGESAAGRPDSDFRGDPLASSWHYGSGKEARKWR